MAEVTKERQRGDTYSHDDVAKEPPDKVDDDQGSGSGHGCCKMHSLEDRKRLPAGMMISTGSKLYEVVKLIGVGGFSDVYVVERDKKRYAMKIEEYQEPRKLERLTEEVKFMEHFQKLRAKQCDRVVELVDKGQTKTFVFYVMELLGKSLWDIRFVVMGMNFSKSTALRIAMQTLDIVEDMHKANILHRDIKLKNFCVGPNDRENLIYVIDFGLSKTFADERGRVFKPPVIDAERRKRWVMCTPRWASRAGHRNEEQGRKDELETWLYMVIDAFDDGALPWMWTRDEEHILFSKELLMKDHLSEVYIHAPRMLSQIAAQLNKMRFEDEPNYGKIRSTLQLMAERGQINTSLPFDWAGCLQPVRLQRQPRSEEATQCDSLEHDDRQQLATENHRELRKMRLSMEEVRACHDKLDAWRREENNRKKETQEHTKYCAKEDPRRKSGETRESNGKNKKDKKQSPGKTRKKNSTRKKDSN